MKSLYLYEEVMLLALRDQEGTFSNNFVEIAVAGAVVAELLLNNHISIDDSRNRKIIDHDNPKKVGDPVIDECLDAIKQAKRRAALTNWIPRLSRIPKLRQKVAQRLIDHGIVKSEEEKILLLFPRTVYPEINPKPERMIIERIKKAIEGDDSVLDPKTVILISIAYRTDLLRHNFDAKMIRKHKKRIEKIVENESAGKAAGEAIDDGVATAGALSLIPALIAGSASS